jgi:cytoskeletal protein CcmA (bactofilin family)
VFAAGRDVTFQSATARNAVVAGYDVELNESTVADMIAAGANVMVAGTIRDDLLAVARSMRVESEGSVGGDARLAAETIDMEGRINGSLRAAARRITIDGTVGGKVDLLAARIVIGSGATINGDLIYRSDAEPEIADGATITGEIRHIEIERPDFPAFGMAMLGIGLVIMLFWAIATLLLVVIVQAAFPGLMAASVDELRMRPWASLGRGVAILLIAWIVAGLLLASVLGMPIGGALAMANAIMWLLGFVTVSACIGLYIRHRRHGPLDVRLGGRIGWALLGAIILGVVSLVPIVGAIVTWLAIAAGVGATASELWWRLRAV